jgi:hypothetical protein
MRTSWIGILLLSVSWIFLLPIYEPPHWAWVVFVILGIAAHAISFRRSGIRAVDRSYALLLAPLILFAVVVGWPHNLGAVVLAFAVVFALSSRQYDRAHRVALALGFSGLVLLAQASVWPLYSHLAARIHNVPALNPVFAFCVNLLGGGATYNQDGLFVKTGSGVDQLYTTWEALGLFFMVNIALGGVILLVLFGRLREGLAKLIALLIAYGVLRYAVLLFIFASFQTSDLFWQRSWTILSFIPLPFILSVTLRFTPEEEVVALPRLSFTGRRALAGILLAVSVSCIILAVTFQDPGVRKQGRILFDEGHSDWEWMARPYDTEWYGEQSGYNYYCLGEFLKHYYQVDIDRRRLTPDLLNRYDVLVLKTPTTPYGRDEIEPVLSFVKAGGGLWLIGDHTNVFGMGTYLNEIATRFGFAFKYDATYDLGTGNLSFYRPAGLRHPVIAHVPFYMFATSDSLDAPLLSEDVIVGYGLKSVRADYSQKSFFPKDAHSATAIEFGLFLQNAAGKFWDGRVLLYTDSTCFSNFYMFMPGKPELALGSIEWLNRRNRYGFVKVILVVAAGLLIGGAFVLLRPVGSLVFGALLFFALLSGVPVALLASSEINARSYARPVPHTPAKIIAFDSDHSSYYLPAKEFATVESDIQTFYVWTQRLGVFPEVRGSFLECLSNSDAVVVINPAREFTEGEITRLITYVENGGKVFLMDDPRNGQRSTAHQLLRPFNIRISFQEIVEGGVEDELGNTIWRGQHLGVVEGGQPYLFVTPVSQENERSAQTADSRTKAAVGKAGALEAASRRPVMCVARRGSGVVAVLANSTMFTSGTMGATAVVPDEGRRKLFDLEFRIFRDLLKLPDEVSSPIQGGK